MSELAVPPGRPGPEHTITARHVERAERAIDRLEDAAPPLRTFVLPRGALPAAEIHVARTVARRAEREVWALHRVEPVSPELVRWLNRVSDLLFALARVVNLAAGQTETPPEYST